jgi:hypothetical protein
VVDEQPPHGLDGGGEEMGTSGEVGPAGEPEVDLMHEGSRLEGVAGRLGREVSRGELPQLVVDEREQFRRSLTVPRRSGIREARNIGQSADSNGRGWQRKGKSTGE